MIWLLSDLGPLVTGSMLAAGPLMAPVLMALLGSAAIAAWWLLDTGFRRRRFWPIRLMAGLPIAGYLVAVGLAAAGVIT